MASKALLSSSPAIHFSSRSTQALERSLLYHYTHPSSWSPNSSTFSLSRWCWVRPWFEMFGIAAICFLRSWIASASPCIVYLTDEGLALSLFIQHRSRLIYTRTLLKFIPLTVSVYHKRVLPPLFSLGILVVSPCFSYVTFSRVCLIAADSMSFSLIGLKEN